ncbi:MAG: hypothetical protein II824_06200 [Bacteroidales bacterium]|nr:hypothetical protein [Bacteroidales bacterium]
MNRKICIVELVIILLTSCGVNMHKQDALSSFYATPFLFPESVSVIQGGMLHAGNTMPEQGLRLVYFFNDYDCSECVVSHLSELERLFEKGSYNLVVWFHVYDEEVLTLLSLLQEAAYEFPVYVSVRQPDINLPELLNYPEYRVFLLDGDSKPIMIGNPLRDDAIADSLAIIGGVDSNH